MERGYLVSILLSINTQFDHFMIAEIFSIVLEISFFLHLVTMLSEGRVFLFLSAGVEALYLYELIFMLDINVGSEPPAQG